jgi:hypothetical protein
VTVDRTTVHEVGPNEDLWRHRKRVVAATRAYPAIDELAARAVAWLDGLTPDDVRRLADLHSSKFDWPST